MTYLKCVTCKVRLYSLASPDDPVRDLCPGCAGVLERVGELTDVVGYRSMKLDDDFTEPQVAPGVLIDGFAEAQARRRAESAQATLETERWLDDGGSFNGLAAAGAAVPAAARTRTSCNSPGDAP